MDSEHLWELVAYYPAYPSALSRMLSPFFRTTFVETAVYEVKHSSVQDFRTLHPYQVDLQFAVDEHCSQSGTQLYRFNLNSNTS